MGKGVSEFFLCVMATVRTGAVMVGQTPLSSLFCLHNLRITDGCLSVRRGQGVREPRWAATTRVPSGVPRILLVHKHDD